MVSLIHKGMDKSIPETLKSMLYMNLLVIFLILNLYLEQYLQKIFLKNRIGILKSYYLITPRQSFIANYLFALWRSCFVL